MRCRSGRMSIVKLKFATSFFSVAYHPVHSIIITLLFLFFIIILIIIIIIISTAHCIRYELAFTMLYDYNSTRNRSIRASATSWQLYLIPIAKNSRIARKKRKRRRKKLISVLFWSLYAGTPFHNSQTSAYHYYLYKYIHMSYGDIIAQLSTRVGYS